MKLAPRVLLINLLDLKGPRNYSIKKACGSFLRLTGALENLQLKKGIQ